MFRATTLLCLAGLLCASARAELNEAELCQAHISAKAWNASVVSCTNAIETGTFQGAALGLLYQTRGEALTQQNLLSEAIEDFSRAIELNPQAAAPIFSRAGLYLRQGHSDKAAADFGQVIRLRPDNVFAHFGLGSAHVQKKSWALAIPALTQAIELRPDYGIAYRMRAEAYAGLGETAKATSDRATAKRLGIAENRPKPKPETPEIAVPSAIIEAPKETRASGNALVDQFVLDALADCARSNANKDWDQAVAACTRAIDSKQLTGSRLAGALGDRAIAYDEALRPEQAMTDYNRALSIDPGNAVILANRAVSLAKDGEMDRAMQDFDRAIAKRPKFAFAYAMRGLTLDAMGETEKAKADLQKAYKYGDRHPVLLAKMQELGLIK